MDNDDRFDELLAEYDEGLAGRTTVDPRPSLGDPVLERRWAEAAACLDLLESVLPRRSDSTRDDDVHSESLAALFPSPTTIGRFLIREELGRGGHGVVFLAFDPILKRDVAIKVPRPEILPSREMRFRFRREAEAAARLEHPNLIAVHEAGEIGPVCFLVSAYCPGPTLAVWLRSQSVPIPINDAVGIVAALADAVGYMHRQGIVHRDIKPGNVILQIPASQIGKSGAFVTFLGPDAAMPRITDFGLAQFLDDSNVQTRTGAVMGTPGYMAPELAQGERNSVGPPTDVYALGVLLYELLTGQVPFLGLTALETLRQVISNDPVTPRRHRKDVSSDLETVVMKCLEKEPARRYQTATELADELQRIISIEPIHARPVGKVGRATRWCRRRPAAAVLIGTTTVAVVAMIIMGLVRNRELSFFNRSLEQMNQSLAASADDAREQQRIAETYSRQVSEGLYAAQMAQADLALREGDIRELSIILNGWSPRPGQRDLRGFEYWYLQNRAQLKDRVQLLSTGSALYCIVHAPDRKTIAAAGKSGTVWLFDERNGAPTGTIETGQLEVNGIAFRADGREMVTAGDDGTIRCWNLATKEQRLCIHAHAQKAYEVVLTKDESSIVSCGSNPVIQVFDAETGELQYTLHGHEGEVDSLALDGDGRTLISTSSDKTYRVWDLQTRLQTAKYNSNHQVGPVAISRQPHFFSVGSQAGTMELLRLPDGGDLGRAEHVDRLKALAVHPDGTLLASGTSTGGIRLWRLDSNGQLENKQVAMWHAHAGGVDSLIWSNDGERLLSAGDDGRVMSWSLATALTSTIKRFPIDSCNRGRFIPCTDLVVCTGKGLKIWNWKTGAHVETVSEEACDWPSISPDGRLIAMISGEKTLCLFGRIGADDDDPHYKALAQWHSDGLLTRAEVAPDSRRIAVCRWVRGAGNADHEHAVWLLSLPDLNEKQKLPPTSVSQLAFSPDSQSLLLHPRDEIGIWSLAANQWLWRVPQLDTEQLIFSNDGELLFSRIDSRSVIVRRTSNGQELRQMPMHRKALKLLAATADGRTLATSDLDGVIRLTHLPTGRALFDLSGGGRNLEMMQFSSDGQNLVCIQHERGNPQANEIVVFEAINANHNSGALRTESHRLIPRSVTETTSETAN